MSQPRPTHRPPSLGQQDCRSCWPSLATTLDARFAMLSDNPKACSRIEVLNVGRLAYLLVKEAYSTRRRQRGGALDP
jgi:hypothetical protein